MLQERFSLLLSLSTHLREYWLLSKPRVTLLVWLTTLAGMLLGMKSEHGSLGIGFFFHALLGSWFVIASANALNQVLEWEYDAQMERTANRPIPARRLRVEEGLAVGVGWGVIGLLELGFFVNLLTATLGALSISLYVFGYTPLKRRTPFCTLVGAVPGAIPPMAGWTAVQNHIGLEALLLFLLQFLWQFPHFWAIAWLNQESYRKVGFRLLPSPVPARTGLYTFQYSGTLLLLTFLFTPFTTYPIAYLAGTTGLGVWFASAAFRFWRCPHHSTARRLLWLSVLYLPLFFLLLLLTRS